MAFIVIEGLDGAGKSTQMGLLRDYVASRGVSHESLHFPRTDAPFFGELVARFLRGELGGIDQVDPYLVALLYAGDRRDAASIINGWLGQGSMVLLDRYLYSNIAFQCAKVSNSKESEKLRDWIIKLEYQHFQIPQPDLNIFLDVPFKFTASRLSERRSGTDRDYLGENSDIHEEDLSFQEKVRKVYLQQEAIDERFVVVPCYNSNGDMESPERIFERIVSLVDSFIK